MLVTAALAAAGRLLVRRRRQAAIIDLDASAHAPEPLTGDPTSVGPTDVAPVP